MKKLILFTAIAGLLVSCNKNEYQESGLVGLYQLVEVLADPGDGSGSFESVNSDKILIFHSDGTISSNGDICNMGIATNVATTGTYSLTDYTINSAQCANLSFELNTNVLIIDYHCIEPCLGKFIKR